MALARFADRADGWRSPWWPVSARVGNGADAGWYEPADELVVRFAGTGRIPAVAIPIAGQPNDDVSLMVVERTGEVVGVQVLPLLASAALRHPSWRSCATPDPPREAVAALVADVRALFDRYGVPPDDVEGS